jgi:plastocyanin
MPRPALLVAVFLLCASCGACGGGGGGGGGAEPKASSTPCPSSAVVVHMKDIRFKPEKASVKVGQTVCWTNDDDVQHDAVDEDGGAFKSPLFGKGDTFSWKAAKAGTISYVCTVHPGMTGELDVTG